MEFVAVDVETANADCATICQIGIARFDEGNVQETWTSLVNPEDYFDGMNISIHGITEADVQDAPRFSDVFPAVTSHLANSVVVHHMPFDRVALGRAARRYGLPPVQAQWIDSARVARRAWAQYSTRGYGLANLAQALEIPLDHHDALSDAVACGMVLRRAVDVSGIGVQDWLVESRRPIGGSVARSGDPAGSLFGERIVFTGKLSIPRREAADLAVAVGCDVASSISRNVTILVVGLQDLRRTKGRKKSSKHRKAEGLVDEGCDIAIIGEEDFLELVDRSDGPKSA